MKKCDKSVSKKQNGIPQTSYSWSLYTIHDKKLNNESIMVMLTSTVLVLSLLPVQYLQALTDKQIEECMLLANHINARVIDTKSQDGIVRLSSGAEVGCEILSFLVYEDGVGVSKEFRPLLTAQEMNECSDKVIAVHDLSREEFTLDEYGIVTFNGGVLELCQALAQLTIEELIQSQQRQYDDNGTAICTSNPNDRALPLCTETNEVDDFFNDTTFADLSESLSDDLGSEREFTPLPPPPPPESESKNQKIDSQVSYEEKSLCEDITDVPVDDFGTVTFEDGTTETCYNLIELQATGGIFPVDGEPDKEITERAIKMRAALGLNASGFPALTFDELIQKFRATPESTPNFEDSEISDEEKSLCEDINPEAKIDDDGTVTMTFDDGTTSTETCDYWIEQQAIGAIFPLTGEGTGMPDKELTERAIKMRAAHGWNASGLPTLTYEEVIQAHQEAIGK